MLLFFGQIDCTVGAGYRRLWRKLDRKLSSTLFACNMLTRIDTSALSNRQSIGIWRLDLITRAALGNKCFKLRSNLRELSGQRVLTFGGAFSNHLFAFAELASQYHIEAIAVIRGEPDSHNEVLSAISRMGTRLHYVSRSEYRCRHDPEYQTELARQLGADRVLPEGGSNLSAVMGCRMIARGLNRATEGLPGIALAVGTGATFAGVTSGALGGQRVIGICVVNDPDTPDRVANWQRRAGAVVQGQLIAANARYAHPDDATLRFVLELFVETGIVLDPVYTGPSLYRLLRGDLSGSISAQDLVFIHTGGLTGAWGMRDRLLGVGEPGVVYDYYARIAELTSAA